MKPVRISSKFQVFIPRHVREPMKLSPGTLVHVFEYQGRIEIVPQKRLTQMRGFLRRKRK